MEEFWVERTFCVFFKSTVFILRLKILSPQVQLLNLVFHTGTVRNSTYPSGFREHGTSQMLKKDQSISTGKNEDMSKHKYRMMLVTNKKKEKKINKKKSGTGKCKYA